MNLLKVIEADLKAWRYLLRNRILISKSTEKAVVEQFHKLYYNANVFGKTFVDTFWLGIPLLKCPLDLWVYQEILHELRPDLIIETGTAGGGSALFLATMLDLIGNGKVVTVDIEPNDKRPAHKRIQYLLGSSLSGEIADEVRRFAAKAEKVMVILDSDHKKQHVLDELKIYSPLVSRGQYLIVEDSDVNGHPVLKDHGPGPMEAIDEFLRHHKEFVSDPRREKFYLTFNPKGFLLKTR